jgi:hypothetical protein
VSGDGEEFLAAEVIEGRDVSEETHHLAIGFQNPADREPVRAMLQGGIVAPDALPVLEGVRDQAPAAFHPVNSLEVGEQSFAHSGRGSGYRGARVGITQLDRGVCATAANPIEDRCDEFPFDRSQRIGRLFFSG